MTETGNRPRPKIRQWLARGWVAFARGWDLYLPAIGYGATFLLTGIAALWLPDLPEVFARGTVAVLPEEGAPAAAHWFGVGPGGIDMMAPVLKSAGRSVWLALFATLAGTALGTMAATVLHYLWRGRLLDGLAEAATATPALIPVLLLTLGFDGGFWTRVAILGGWCALPIAARCAQWYREMDGRGDVLAARAMGWTRWRLLGDQLLSRIWQRAAATATQLLPGVLLAEATLGFIRSGWETGRLGHLIAAGGERVLEAPWLLYWPGAMLAALSVLLAAFGWAVRRAVDEPVHERLW